MVAWIEEVALEKVRRNQFLLKVELPGFVDGLVVGSEERNLSGPAPCLGAAATVEDGASLAEMEKSGRKRFREFKQVLCLRGLSRVAYSIPPWNSLVGSFKNHSVVQGGHQAWVSKAV